MGVSLCVYFCLATGLQMYNNKLHIELAYRLIDRLIYMRFNVYIILWQSFLEIV